MSARKFLFLLALCFFSLSFSGCFIATSYTHSSYRRALNHVPFDVVIVPGVPFGDSATSSVFRARILWAKYLFEQKLTKNIIFSGAAVYSPYEEGKVMKLIAEGLGLPAGHVFSETQAEHSTENVYYSWKMAKNMGFENIALATDPFQTIMVQGFIEKHCPEVHTIPIVFQRIDMESNPWLPTFNPKAALKEGFVNLEHRESFWERFKGTRGKKIIFD
jgi:uncharacterized SAM-binding protein YcdF (DUF218 family)